MPTADIFQDDFQLPEQEYAEPEVEYDHNQDFDFDEDFDHNQDYDYDDALETVTTERTAPDLKNNKAAATDGSPIAPPSPIRLDFPASNTTHLGGTSDGFRYRTTFGGATLKQSFSMLRQFLAEEGYGDVLLPKNVEELLYFKHPPVKKALKLFEDYGYVHHPIKIFFHPHLRKSTTLILEIFNEHDNRHLLRFHGFLAEDAL